MTEEDIKSEIVRLSGSGKKVAPGARQHGIYSSFTFPPFDQMRAVRDTRKRFEDFGLYETPPTTSALPLSGKRFLDVGSNVGAVSFHAAGMGAEVTGVEYREDRVQLCNVIADRYLMEAKFYQTDLNEVIANESKHGDDMSSPSWMAVQYDVVWCSSVDEYVNDVLAFYATLHSLCADKLYFECNRQGGVSVTETEILLKKAGFKNVMYRGNGHSGGIARKRKLFTAEV